MGSNGHGRDLRGKAAELKAATQPKQAPVDNGERLATIARGEAEELRLSWCTFEGKPYLNLRLWSRADDGQWWPNSKKGISIRIRELPDLCTGLADALDKALALQQSRPPRPEADGWSAPQSAGGGRRAEQGRSTRDGHN